MSDDVRTLVELAREALAVQDACNVRGVVRGYTRALDRLSELCPELSTTALAQHPISQAWADKIASLAGVQAGLGSVWDAYQALERTLGEGRQLSKTG